MGRPTSLALAFLPTLKPMLSLSFDDCCALESFGSWAASGRAAASSTNNSAARRARWLCWVADAGEPVIRVSRFVALEIFILNSHVRTIIHTRAGARVFQRGVSGWPARIREI